MLLILTVKSAILNITIILEVSRMCTAATYKTNDFYFGRTLDYEFSYGDEVTVTPRNYPINFRFMGVRNNH